ncbi:uncharacterized protein LOC131161509 isoform X4 [Malania oleifera]|uniref:uncharacterized protein LOC131161509 isoform X4 n=1 Tax=Malania oleifera TaxID=397392 RepID=UPI0025ADD7F2|nr:uncharacterized protein LOC131161509 isoform X4 [Malania oleifera]
MLAIATPSLLLLTGKEVMSIVDNCYLHIKPIGGNSQDNYPLHEGSQGVLLEGHIGSSQMFLRNAMCQWVNLLIIIQVTLFVFYKYILVVLLAFEDNVMQVLKVEDHEADDVVATLVGQVLRRGYRVVIASPDKDFMQLISKDVQIVMPIAELDRWSFYTVKHYRAQYSCHPHFDLSLRSIIGDEVDGVPGIQQVVPGFGRKTAVKLLKRHGSLENLLGAAAVRTVGRPYAQDALTMHADFLRRNYEVLALRRDIDVHLQEEWLSERDAHNDSVILLNFVKWLEESNKLNKKSGSHTSNLCV